jgi:3-methylfumaryl-CoA hydratase
MGADDRYRAWIGKTRTARDIAAAAPVARLSATLDRDDPAPEAGDPLPPAWHWLYFLEAVPMHEIGADGHAKRGEFLPPVPLPRRIWAGGRFQFRAPIRIGDEIERISEIVDVALKEGRTGPLAFCTVRHTISAGGVPCVIEEHDIDYRGAPAPCEEPTTAKAQPQLAPIGRAIKPEPELR